MKPRYRIFTVGGVPIDLKKRIAAIHAEAILKARSGDRPVQVSAEKTDKAPSVVTGKVREFAQ